MRSRNVLLSIVILLACARAASAVLYDDGMGSEQAQQEIIAERQAAEVKFLAQERQKALDEQQVRERLTENEARVNQIKEVRSTRNDKKSTVVLPLAETNAKAECSSQKIYVIFLVCALIICIYLIFRLSRK